MSRRDLERRDWICGIVVWLAIVVLFFYFFLRPLFLVVPQENRGPLIISIVLLTGAIFCCSALETISSSNTAYHFNEWFNALTDNPDDKMCQRRDQAIESIKIKYKAQASSIIVMLNTIFAVLLSVATLKLVKDVGGIKILGLDASDRFVIIGITVILFVFGEMVPKQIALKNRNPLLLHVGFILAGLSKWCIISWIGKGLTAPFVLIFGRNED